MHDILPIRRSQLIAPFGVGAIPTGKDGISLITAGLDAWFDDDGVKEDEFLINDEPRLAGRLHVEEFRLPPDFRRSERFHSAENVNLKIPFLRFPQWHSCSNPKCGWLKKYPLTYMEMEPRCEEPRCWGKMHQVRFIAVCENGHVQDFPWWEWVQETAHSVEEGKLYLKSSGGGGLGGLKVVWKRNGHSDVQRTLAGITKEGALLERITNFRCLGIRPWLGEEVGTMNCDGKLRGALRSASNLHFAQIASAIYLPPEGTERKIGEIHNICKRSEVGAALAMVLSFCKDENVATEKILNKYGKHFEGYSKSDVAFVIKKYFMNADADEDFSSNDTSEEKFRYAEFARLNNRTQDLDHLKTVANPISKYNRSEQMKKFSSVVLVEKLKETRAFNGFSRVNSQSVSVLERNRQLWKYKPGKWLPAYQVFGEGIFFSFDNVRIQEWSKLAAVQERVKKLVDNYRIAAANRSFERTPESITPQFVMIHTFAHLLLNQLTFECGYSSASLRERLFVSSREEILMNGVMIYTASGDSEGSMGGLVSSGRPGNLENVLERALDNATWCSSDPICMEVGGMNGQGPDSLNLAACHNCALLPETACEEFNRLLDRGLVIGTFQNPEMGYFRRS
ncbi:MAG: DUF1998 domain-containing protein [Kiritimatiellae bacterium]|jgi:hypothetical protein|nr:DUF1998 domain-containing protein [Kiritimatiellia bacterium]